MDSSSVARSRIAVQPKPRRLSQCPLPLRERAARRFSGTDWVRGKASSPHPSAPVERPALPAPARREGAITRARFSGAVAVGAIVIAAFLVAPLSPWQARAEQRVPGLTGVDRAADVVQARQLLMSGIEEDMQPVDLAAGGKDSALDELKANAYRINIMLAAFPHLFPPQTRPSTGPDALSTAAAPEIWQEFDAFYSQSEAAAKAAYDASQASTIEQFRERAGKLRAACDGCHGKYMKVQSPTPP